MFWDVKHRDRAVEDQASLYLAITQLMKAPSLVTSDCAYDPLQNWRLPQAFWYKLYSKAQKTGFTKIVFLKNYMKMI